MTLSSKAAGLDKGVNMQDNAAAFEAWCFIIKAYTNIKNLKIMLDIDGVVNDRYVGGIPSNGHLGRFLYRILKFKEQYGKWFLLSDELEAMRKNFADFYVGVNLSIMNLQKKQKMMKMCWVLQKAMLKNVFVMMIVMERRY